MNGHTLYKEIWLAQVPPTLEFLKEKIKVGEFDQIIEIGTNRGGLTLFLSDERKSGAKLVSYDITRSHLLFPPEDHDIDFREKNCFENGGLEIQNLLKEGGRTLLLCDGGSKDQEFVVFSKFLKDGDVIMCHDFCDDEETYRNVQSKYNWQTPAESFMKNIEQSVKENKLTPFFFNEGKNCIWGSFIK